MEFVAVLFVSRPRIVMCEASDGHSYRQLVKGDDDIRQDAVMMQVSVIIYDPLCNGIIVLHGAASSLLHP